MLTHEQMVQAQQRCNERLEAMGVVERPKQVDSQLMWSGTEVEGEASKARSLAQASYMLEALAEADSPKQLVLMLAGLIDREVRFGYELGVLAAAEQRQAELESLVQKPPLKRD